MKNKNKLALLIMNELLTLMWQQIRNYGDAAQTLSWHSLSVVRGTYRSEDCINEVIEIKFDRSIAIKVLLSYPLTLISNGSTATNQSIQPSFPLNYISFMDLTRYHYYLDTFKATIQLNTYLIHT